MENITETVTIPLNAYKSLLSHEYAVYALRAYIEGLAGEGEADLGAVEAMLRMSNYDAKADKARRAGDGAKGGA